MLSPMRIVEKWKEVVVACKKKSDDMFDIIIHFSFIRTRQNLNNFHYNLIMKNSFINSTITFLSETLAMSKKLMRVYHIHN